MKTLKIAVLTVIPYCTVCNMVGSCSKRGVAGYLSDAKVNRP